MADRVILQTQSPSYFSGAIGLLSNSMPSQNPFSSLSNVFSGCQLGQGVNLDQIQGFSVRLSDSLSTEPILALFSTPESSAVLKANVDSIAEQKLKGVTDIDAVLSTVETGLFSEDGQKPSPVKLKLMLPNPGQGKAILAISHDTGQLLGTAKKALKRAGTTKLFQVEEPKPDKSGQKADEKKGHEPASTEAGRAADGKSPGAKVDAPAADGSAKAGTTGTKAQEPGHEQKGAIQEPIDDRARIDELQRGTLFRGQTVRFFITLPDGTRRYFVLKPNESINIGSGLHNDIIIQHQDISQNHLRIINNDGLLFIEDINGSKGVVLENTTVFASNIKNKSTLTLGKTQVISIDPVSPKCTRLSVTVKVYELSSEDESRPLSSSTHTLNPGETLSAGKKEGSAIKLDGGMVSDNHFVLVNKDGFLYIEDQSSEGVLDVNAQRMPANVLTLIGSIPGHFVAGHYHLVIDIEKIEEPTAKPQRDDQKLPEAPEQKADTTAGQGPVTAKAPEQTDGEVPLDDAVPYEEGYSASGQQAQRRAATPNPDGSWDLEEDLSETIVPGEVVAEGSASIPLDLDGPETPKVSSPEVSPVSTSAPVAGADSAPPLAVPAATPHSEIKEEAPPSTDSGRAVTGTDASSQRKSGDETKESPIKEEPKVEPKDEAPQKTDAPVATTQAKPNIIIRFIKFIADFFVSLYRRFFPKKTSDSKKDDDSGPKGPGPSEMGGGTEEGVGGTAGPKETTGPKTEAKTDEDEVILTIEEDEITEVPEGTISYSLKDTLAKLDTIRQPYRSLYEALVKFNQVNGGDNLDESSDETSEPILSDSESFLKLFLFNGAIQFFEDDDIEEAVQKALKEDLLRIQKEFQKAKALLSILEKAARAFIATVDGKEDFKGLELTNIDYNEILLRLQIARQEFKLLHSQLKAYRMHIAPDTKEIPPLLSDDQLLGQSRIHPEFLYSEDDIALAFQRAALFDVYSINLEIANIESSLEEEIMLVSGEMEEVVLSPEDLEDDTDDAPPLSEAAKAGSKDPEVERLERELEKAREELRLAREENDRLSRSMQEAKDTISKLSIALIQSSADLAKKTSQAIELGEAQQILKEVSTTLEALLERINGLQSNFESRDSMPKTLSQ